jgi:hypothetical protein
MTDRLHDKSPDAAQPGRERRAFRAERLEIEERKGGRGSRLVGHAAVFNQLSEDLGGFREQVAPGAFAASIERDDIRALFNHDPTYVLGRNGAGTLDLEEDARGLAITIDMPSTPIINELVTAPIRRGDIDQMSFAFRTVAQSWATVDGERVRTLLVVQLFEISPVTFPAYPQTDVAARALRDFIAAPAGYQAAGVTSARDLERLLRDMGFSRSAARRITARGWPGVACVDDDAAVRIARARQRAAKL